MADNITISEGTAKAIAADDVSSVWYQRVKLDVGADGLSSAFTGTVEQVSNLAGGSVVVTAATVGTLSAYPLISGEDQTNDVMKTEQQFSYAYSAAVGTTVVKAAAGFLHGVLLGSTSAGGAITIYDNATGTSTAIMVLIKASAVEGFYPFNCKATSGIVVANVGTQIYTAVYR